MPKKFTADPKIEEAITRADSTPFNELSIAELQALAAAGEKAPLTGTLEDIAIRKLYPTTPPDVKSTAKKSKPKFDTVQEVKDPPEYVSIPNDLQDRIKELINGVSLPTELLQDLGITASNLDDEMLNQPVLFAQYAIMHAQAVASYEEVKDSVGIIRATLDGVVREEFAVREEKSTEARVEAAILCHDDYVGAIATKIEANKQMQIAAAIREAFAMRATMITMLVSSRNKEYEQTR